VSFDPNYIVVEKNFGISDQQSFRDHEDENKTGKIIPTVDHLGMYNKGSNSVSISQKSSSFFFFSSQPEVRVPSLRRLTDAVRQQEHAQ
jgi:hypothetical protein